MNTFIKNQILNTFIKNQILNTFIKNQILNTNNDFQMSFKNVGSKLDASPPKKTFNMVVCNIDNMHWWTNAIPGSLRVVYDSEIAKYTAQKSRIVIVHPDKVDAFVKRAQEVGLKLNACVTENDLGNKIIEIPNTFVVCLPYTAAETAATADKCLMKQLKGGTTIFDSNKISMPLLTGSFLKKKVQSLENLEQTRTLAEIQNLQKAELCKKENALVQEVIDAYSLVNWIESNIGLDLNGNLRQLEPEERPDIENLQQFYHTYDKLIQFIDRKSSEKHSLSESQYYKTTIDNLASKDYGACGICLDDIKCTDVGVTPCGHVFCFSCLCSLVDHAIQSERDAKCPNRCQDICKSNIFRLSTEEHDKFEPIVHMHGAKFEYIYKLARENQGKRIVAYVSPKLPIANRLEALLQHTGIMAKVYKGGAATKCAIMSEFVKGKTQLLIITDQKLFNICDLSFADHFVIGHYEFATHTKSLVKKIDAKLTVQSGYAESACVQSVHYLVIENSPECDKFNKN